MVYTVPGQVKHDATRKAVLQRADGVAFIADSRPSEATNNAGSFENLEKNLSYVGLDIETIPLIIQYNKRDLPQVIPEEDIHRIWGLTGIPVFMASALYGNGVLENYTALLKRTYDRLDGKYELNNAHGLDRDSFVHRLSRLQDIEAA
jgi:mutual gliding-motility protein MglA